MVMPPILRYFKGYFTQSSDVLYHRHLLTLFGFRITVLIHAAFMSTTILAGLTFKPVPVLNRDKDPAEGVQEQRSSCSGGIWFPKLSQIFIWKVLRNPLFIVLSVSAIMGRQMEWRCSVSGIICCFKDWNERLWYDCASIWRIHWPEQGKQYLSDYCHVYC